MAGDVGPDDRLPLSHDLRKRARLPQPPGRKEMVHRLADRYERIARRLEVGMGRPPPAAPGGNGPLT